MRRISRALSWRGRFAFLRNIPFLRSPRDTARAVAFPPRRVPAFRARRLHCWIVCREHGLLAPAPLGAAGWLVRLAVTAFVNGDHAAVYQRLALVTLFTRIPLQGMPAHGADLHQTGHESTPLPFVSWGQFYHRQRCCTRGVNHP